MSEANPQLEQPRGEDGRFATTKSPQPATADPAATATPSTQQPTSASAPAQGEDASRKSIYESAAAAVNAKCAKQTPTGSEVGRTTTDTAKPPATAAVPADASATPSPSPTATTKTPPEKQDDPYAAAVKGYDGRMSKQTYALLKSIPGMLPDAAAWAGMDDTERMDHVQTVRDIRNQRNKQFDASRRPSPGVPGADDDDLSPSSGRPAGDTSAPNRTGVGAARGNGPVPPAPQGPPQQQRAVAAADVEPGQLPPDVLAEIAAVNDELGEQHPVAKAFTRQAIQQHRLETTLQAHETRAERTAAADRNERQTVAYEDQIFSSLAAKYPKLADPAVRDQLRQECRDYFLTAQNRGRVELTPQRAIELVTHNTLYPEIQEQQRSQTDAARQRSLERTFEAGPPTAPARVAGSPQTESADPTKRMQAIADKLNRATEQGLVGEARRNAVMPGVA